jgi:hypothetical protein
MKPKITIDPVTGLPALTAGPDAPLLTSAQVEEILLKEFSWEADESNVAGHDGEIRFKAMAARDSRKTGLALLDKLDRSFAER